MLEVCVDSIESAVAAEKGGASRIELCSALSEGGLTPTPGMLKALKSDMNCKIPIFCMLRPRRGNDFHFTAAEIQSIVYDIQVLRENGADGFVFGALDSDGNIDTNNCKIILRATGDLPVTFHRAFDLTDFEKMEENLQIIEDLGFKRILTSGFENTAQQGIEAIKKLIDTAKDIIVMPGSGINAANINQIMVETHCKEVHASARQMIANSENNERQLSMGGGKEDIKPRMITCSKLVQELVDIARNTKLTSK